MAESHTKGEQRHSPVATAASGSATVRASDARPPKPYVASERAARQEPPEVTAARERHRALTAEIGRRRAVLEARLDVLAAEARKACGGDG
jgi:hypothetical protein